jgi:hypothetical protein
VNIFKDLLFMLGLGPILALVAELLKIELTILQAKILDNLQQVFKLAILSAFCMAIFCCGFLLIHVAIFLYVPYSMATKALLMFILGAIYFFIPLICVLWLSSKNRWLKILGKNSVLNKIRQKTFL